MASSSTCNNALNLLHLLLFISASLCFIPLLAASSGAGFSVELMHRDHPESPLYDPTSTPFDRAMAAARRSRLRVQQMAGRSRLSFVTNSVVGEITRDDFGEYIMAYEVGTPPFEIRVVLDTGSDLMWTYCKPCDGCSQAAPHFDPTSSSTHRTVPCGADACNVLSSSQCNNQGACQFRYAYAGGTNLDGTLATETISFATTEGGKAAFHNYTFGCAFHFGGDFPQSASGVLGLSPNALSLMTQIGSDIGRKFSYCLPPIGNPLLKTKLNFGDAAVVPAGAAATPLPLDDFFYAVILREIVVGGKTISVPLDPNGHGNMMVDSGTTLTLLVPEVLQQVSDAVGELVKLPRATDIQYSTFGICFEDKGQPDGGAYPGMTFNFDGGASVQLAPINAFIKVGNDAVCLAMSVVSKRMIMGNMAQQNMHVVYDLEQKKISFAPADCSKA